MTQEDKDKELDHYDEEKERKAFEVLPCNWMSTSFYQEALGDQWSRAGMSGVIDGMPNERITSAIDKLIPGRFHEKVFRDVKIMIYTALPILRKQSEPPKS